MAIFYLPIIRCLFSNVLYDSYIYKFDAFYFKIMAKSYSNCSTYVLKWFRYLYGTFLRFHTVHLITEPFTIIRQVIASLNTQSITFILLMVLLQTVIVIFVKRSESGKMIWHIMILLIIIIALQLIIGHFFHKMVLV